MHSVPVWTPWNSWQRSLFATTSYEARPQWREAQETVLEHSSTPQQASFKLHTHHHVQLKVHFIYLLPPNIHTRSYLLLPPTLYFLPPPPPKHTLLSVAALFSCLTCSSLAIHFCTITKSTTQNTLTRHAQCVLYCTIVVMATTLSPYLVVLVYSLSHVLHLLSQ